MLTRSPSAFGARFTLVRVYRLLRAPALYIPHLAKLDLTEIQLDNLLHIVSERGGLEARVAGPAVAKAWGEVVAKAVTMYSRSATEVGNAEGCAECCRVAWASGLTVTPNNF
jgi:N-terminal acetyltransferase B complex non-catalytic subunit